MRRWSTELRLANIMTQNYEKKKRKYSLPGISCKSRSLGDDFHRVCLLFFIIFIEKNHQVPLSSASTILSVHHVISSLFFVFVLSAS